MQYKLKQKDNNLFIFNSEDALFEVNRKLKENNNLILDFTYFLNDYNIDFLKQELSINGTLQSLKLPKNNQQVRWINFRRVSLELATGIKTVVYYIGFQVTVDGVCYKRMVKISDDKYEIVEYS